MNLGQLKISIEDRFIILQLNVEDDLLPTGDTLDKLAYLLASFSPKHQIICDFRNVKHITNDLINFIKEFEFYQAQVLLDEKYLSIFQEHVNPKIPLLAVNKFETRFEEHNLDLTIFADGHSIDSNFKDYNKVRDDLTNRYKGLPTREEFDLFSEREGLDINFKQYYKSYEDYISFCKSSLSGIHLGSELIIGHRYLADFIKKNNRTSLLSQYCFFPKGDGSFDINIFQSNTINIIEAKNQLIHGKPYVSSRVTQDIYQNTLSKYQDLISDKKVKENQIQKFLEENPIFLQSLGYKSIRPQIILERDDGTSLKPDFLLEPIGDEWWDILDIKLPFKKVIIDTKKDRIKFSESMNELQAQLREYASYFENEKYAKRIEDKYGIKCYKPKLIGIIGNEFNRSDERQVRRLITSYSDLKVVSFPDLYKICKERVLI